MNETETLCDRCMCVIDEVEAWPGEGEWEGAVLCPDCYLLFNDERKDQNQTSETSNLGN